MQTHALPLAPPAGRLAAGPGQVPGELPGVREAERAMIAFAVALRAGWASWTGQQDTAAAIQAARVPAARTRAARVPAARVPAARVPAARAPAVSLPAARGAVQALSPGVRGRARRAALAVGAFLVPWSVMLSVTLPSTAQAHHWAMAWTGLDAAEAVAALATAVLLTRSDSRACLPAMAGGVLLITDAWFDVCTSAPGMDHALSLAEAACVELPLAAAAFWLAARLYRGRPLREHR